MKKDTQDLEKQLHDQQAVELNEALLDRLEAAADDTLIELNEEEVKFEAQLRTMLPQGLSPQLLESLESKVEGLPAPTQVHVLPFPDSKTHNRANRRINQERKTPAWAAAAAAVALLGVISAWWLDPIAGNTPAITDKGSPTEFIAPDKALPTTTPAEFSRALSNTQDQGIIWGDNNEPHRVIKVTYTDRVSMKRDDGSTYEVEKPSVEYYLVPAESQ